MKAKILTTALCAVLALAMQGCGKSGSGTAVGDATSVQAGETIGRASVKSFPVDVQGKAILDDIIAAYSGRVVLVDFWATWCPPCRRAMTEIDAIKPELISQGAAFVYITGETSPLADWREAIKDIEGDHYRLTDAQWESLLSELGVPGIPVYLLVGRDGETLFSNLTEGGYPGNATIKPLMEKAL